MKYPVRRGLDGSFQELARRSNVEFGQLSLLEVSPGCSRGDHYHMRKKEWFCPISGKGLLMLRNIKTNESRIVRLNGFKNREFFLAEPYEEHTVVSQERYSDLIVLVIISEEFDSEDSDTFFERREE